jgi:hypothetical protein
MNTEFQNADGLVVCPLSLDRAHLLTDFKLHHCHPDELAANGGVCATCRAKAAKTNGRFKTHDEQPVESASHDPAPEHNHVAFDDSGESIQSVDFPFEQLDQDAEDFFANASPDVRRDAAIAVGLMLEWIWSGGWRSAQRKFAAFTAGLRPDLIDNATYAEIGKRLGCTKAAISKAAVRCQEQFNIKFTRSRSEESRGRMAAAQIGHAPRSTSKRNEPSVGPTTPPGNESYQTNPSLR